MSETIGTEMDGRMEESKDCEGAAAQIEREDRTTKSSTRLIGVGRDKVEKYLCPSLQWKWRWGDRRGWIRTQTGGMGLSDKVFVSCGDEESVAKRVAYH